jgi:hypothetical protein
VPCPFTGYIEALKEGKARVIFLNLIDPLPKAARDGPFPTSLCRTFIKKVCGTQPAKSLHVDYTLYVKY